MGRTAIACNPAGYHPALSLITRMAVCDARWVLAEFICRRCCSYAASLAASAT
jgi:hypothetical protein